MTKIDSPHWDRSIGVCVKHMLPSVPCPACLAEPRDEDVEERLDELDLFVIQEQEEKEITT